MPKETSVQLFVCSVVGERIVKGDRVREEIIVRGERMDSPLILRGRRWTKTSAFRE